MRLITDGDVAGVIFTAQYETFTIGAGGALNPNQLGNKKLRPEVSTETEYGMDLELFSKYGVTVTKSHNVIDDQLLQPPPPAAAGFASPGMASLRSQVRTASIFAPAGRPELTVRKASGARRISPFLSSLR